MENGTFIQNADQIASLPTNQNQPSYDELKIVDTLFKQHGNTMNKIVDESKEAVFIVILFIVFSNTQVDDLIKRFIPITQSSIYLLVSVKAIIIIIVFWTFKNFWLSRK
jgi:hypothetical protein